MELNSLKKDRTEFYIYNALMIIALVVLVIISILDKYYSFYKWGDDIDSKISMSIQVLTSVVSLIASTIGIAITLQNDEYYGIKTYQLYAMRTKKHYSVYVIIIISIVLCALSFVFYYFNLTIASIGLFFIACSFCSVVAKLEIPLMSKNKEVILGVLKEYLVYCYFSSKIASESQGTVSSNKKTKKSKSDINKESVKAFADEPKKAYKDCIRFFLIDNNLAETYNLLKDEKDNEFNNYLMCNLLEYQQKIALDLHLTNGNNKTKDICDTLFENVFDVALRRFEFSDSVFESVLKNKYWLTRVLFKLHSIPECKKQFAEKLYGIVQYLDLPRDDMDKSINLVMHMLIVIGAEDIKEGNVDVLRTIQKELSASPFGIHQNTPTAYLCAIFSFQLYYLCECEDDCPETTKVKLLSFLKEPVLIEGSTRIETWNYLFLKITEKHAYDFKKINELIINHQDYLEYYLYGNGAKCMVINEAFVAHWFLTNYLNSNVWEYDVDGLLKQFEDNTQLLKSFGESCLNADNCFQPTERMKAIVKFYNGSDLCFTHFSIVESDTHAFSNMINKIRAEDLKKEAETAGQIDNEKLQDEMQREIIKAMESEWGFNKNLLIDAPERGYNLLVEKFADVNNYNTTLIESFIRGIYHDIYKNSKARKIFKNPQFFDSLDELLSKNITHMTKTCKTMLPHYLRGEQDLYDRLIELSTKAEIINSHIFTGEVLFCENGFNFNFELTKCQVRNLTDTELLDVMNKYRRSDGQYVYNGTFLPPEELKTIILRMYIVVTVAFKYSTTSTEDTVFEVFTYKEKDDRVED